MLDFGWSSYNITNLSRRPAHIELELWAQMKAVRERIDRKDLPRPTEHRALLFEDDFITFRGTVGASARSLPSKPPRTSRKPRIEFWKASA